MKSNMNSEEITKSKRNVIIRHSWSLDLKDEENEKHEFKEHKEHENKNKLLNAFKKRSLKLFHSLDEDFSANKGIY